MSRSGRRHRLILYTYMLNRWWRLTLGIGVVLLALVAALTGLPGIAPQLNIPAISDSILWLTGAVGAFSIFLTFFLIGIRKSAYVQPFDTHLRLITPFLRLNISYRRFRQTNTAEMRKLYPPEKYKGYNRQLLRRLAKNTAIVLDLNGWPIERWALGLFLSPFFFPDKSPRLALIVPDWISFSNEMESFRGAFQDSARPSVSDPQADVLSSMFRHKHKR
jgi:hypothetical protein